MLQQIPAAVRNADAIHHRILQRIFFSQYLNPCNIREARRIFERGAEAPPFQYRALTEADELLIVLDKALPTLDHPAAQLVHDVLSHTMLVIKALRDRTNEAFDRLACSAGWYPDPDLLALRFPNPNLPPRPSTRTAQELIENLQRALGIRGMHSWQIVEDTIMAARVMVDGAKRQIRVHPNARFRERDFRRLIAHEIDVHVVRASNGEAQQLHCFSTGLPGSLVTEEGLAMIAEERAHAATPGVLSRQVEVVRAIHNAREVGFRDLYDDISMRCNPGLAWGICLRIKRGLSNPEDAGVYAKDSVYLNGHRKVSQWLQDGNDITQLYVGKVGIEHPVALWLAQGWVQPGAVPGLWRTNGQ